jgi:hypothetical protein
MLATLLTLGFAAAALFALATLGASLARGVAVAAALPRGRGVDSNFRSITVRSASTSAGLMPVRASMASRLVRRPARPALAQVRSPQRVAA